VIPESMSLHQQVDMIIKREQGEEVKKEEEGLMNQLTQLEH
jgi:hypothetical protein